MERRPKRPRLFEDCIDEGEIDNELKDDSEVSSLFSSDGGSVYHPSSDSSEEESESEVSDNDNTDDQPEVIEFAVGLDLNSPLLDNPNIEFIPNDDNDDLLGDPNVAFVVSSVHQHYQNTESLWTNTSNSSTLHNFLGQEKIHIETTNPVEIFGHTFDDGLLNKICFLDKQTS